MSANSTYKFPPKELPKRYGGAQSAVYVRLRAVHIKQAALPQALDLAFSCGDSCRLHYIPAYFCLGGFLCSPLLILSCVQTANSEVRKISHGT